MKRKLIKQGAGGQTISLPIDWVRSQHLKDGDEVNVISEGDELRISGKGSSTLKKKEIKLLHHNHKEYIRSVIASSYKSGYDVITLRFEELPSMQFLQSIISTFTGLEIISHNGNTVQIKSFLQSDSEEIEILIIKMFQMINLMFDAITANIKIDELKNIKQNVQKTRDHCLRLIAICNYENDKKYDYYDFTTQLEKIASDLSYLGEYLLSHPEVQKTLFDILKSRFDEVYTCYLKKDFNITHKLWVKQRNELKEEKKDGLKHFQNLFKKHDPVIVMFYFHIIERYLHLASRMLSLHTV